MTGIPPTNTSEACGASCLLTQSTGSCRDFSVRIMGHEQDDTGLESLREDWTEINEFVDLEDL